MHNRIFGLLFCGLVLTVAGAHSRAESPSITLGSTTSTQASGFFDYLLPLVHAKTGINVRVVAVGTGQALKLAERGDVDVLLVHDDEGEQRLVADGFGVDRRAVMYNDFIVIGPESDPARINHTKSAVAAFRGIAAQGATFVSRADDSGTHRQELRLWRAAGVDVTQASGGWYKELGASMGATLNTAAGLAAYTLSDRASWTTFNNKRELVLLLQGDPVLFNQYSVIGVNPQKHPHVKAASARAFADYLTSADGQRAIGEYVRDGITLFHPNFGQAPGPTNPQ